MSFFILKLLMTVILISTIVVTSSEYQGFQQRTLVIKSNRATTPPQGEDKPSPLLWTDLASRFVGIVSPAPTIHGLCRPIRRIALAFLRAIEMERLSLPRRWDQRQCATQQMAT